MNPQAASSLMHQAARRGRPKVPREPSSETDRRRQSLIATRKAAMSPVKLALAKMSKTQAWLVGQLAERAHLSMSQQTISNYLNGHAGIAEDTLIWICAICGLNAQDILTSVADRMLLLQAVKRPLRYQRHQQTDRQNPKQPTKATQGKPRAAMLTHDDSQATS